MDRRICISSGDIQVIAALNDTATAQAIWDALPIESTCNTWGDEVYFSIPLALSLDETAREVVAMGDIGYWPPGSALCIFFGPTPVSTGDEIRPASAVNIVGNVLGDPKVFKGVAPGSKIYIKKAP